ncbi:MAG: DUF4197 domain-containing protein [Chitinophagaceae bacterium]|nr:DUF4197 domain-containing protein [Chitinophagaceae bacterium]
MKNLLFILLATFSLQTVQAQTFNDLLNQANKALNGGGNKNGQSNNNGLNNILGGGLSNTEIVNGLKEALRVSSQNAAGILNKTNGFFGNQVIKILMPPEAKKIESTLRSFGFNKQCDNVILSLNRAAEDAAGKAVPIFINAITSMSINDGLSILRGGNNAATEFLKRTTTNALTNAFRPVIQNSLGKVGATKYWTDIFTIYNRLPITRQKVNTDLPSYVTERALNGLFVTVAQEEQNIRQNPGARVTDLLKKVFGGGK